MQGFRLWLTTVCSMQGIRISPLSHDPFSFPSEEACRLSPPGADSQSLPSAEVFRRPAHGLEFYSADRLLLASSARPPGAVLHI